MTVKPKASTKEALLEAARSFLDRPGPDGGAWSLDDLVKASGRSRATVYRNSEVCKWFRENIIGSPRALPGTLDRPSKSLKSESYTALQERASLLANRVQLLELLLDQKDEPGNTNVILLAKVQSDGNRSR